MTTPWKILALGNREGDLSPLREELACAGRECEMRLVHNVADVSRSLDEHPWDAAILTARLSHIQLAQVLTELRGRDTLMPILLVVRANEAAAELEGVCSGVTGVLFIEVLSLLPGMLEREIHRFREAKVQQRRQQRLCWIETAMNAAPVALAVANREGVLLWANAAYLKLVGLEAEAIEQATATIWPASDAPWAEVNEAIHSGQFWRGTIPAAQSEGGDVVLHQSTMQSIRGRESLLFSQRKTARI